MEREKPATAKRTFNQQADNQQHHPIAKQMLGAESKR